MTKESMESLRRRVAELEGEVAVYIRMSKQDREEVSRLTAEVARKNEELKRKPVSSGDNSGDVELARLISTLTLKQLAVLFATLRGKEYTDIAKVLGVDPTTVKLHLKAAMGKLHITNRNELLMRSQDAIAGLEKLNLGELFGIDLDWMENPSTELLAKLAPVRTTTPPPATKGPTKRY